MSINLINQGSYRNISDLTFSTACSLELKFRLGVNAPRVISQSATVDRSYQNRTSCLKNKKTVNADRESSQYFSELCSVGRIT